MITTSDNYVFNLSGNVITVTKEEAFYSLQRAVSMAYRKLRELTE